jgi:hypothetical protein
MVQIEEMCGLLRSKRPGDEVEYQPETDGVHFVFSDARRRRFVFVIDHDLLEGRSPKQIVDWLDLLNWQLVMSWLSVKWRSDVLR